jgi:hypothetical protein
MPTLWLAHREQTRRSRQSGTEVSTACPLATWTKTSSTCSSQLERRNDQMATPGEISLKAVLGTIQLASSSGRAYEELTTNVELFTKCCLYIASNVDKLVDKIRQMIPSMSVPWATVPRSRTDSFV